MPLRLAHAWWSFGAVLVVMVTFLSLAPPGEGSARLPDKLVHFATYFVLAFWFVSLTPRRWHVAFAGVILLGGVIELLQGLTPQRFPEWLDFLANTSGAILALLVVRLLPVNFFVLLEQRLPLARS